MTESKTKILKKKDIESMTVEKTRDEKFKRMKYSGFHLIERNRTSFNTFMIFQSSKDQKYRIYEVENGDRFRRFRDYEFEFTGELFQVCHNSKFISFYDPKSESLKLVRLPQNENFELSLSPGMKKNYKNYSNMSERDKMYNPSSLDMSFSKTSKYFFMSFGGMQNFPGDEGEIMVVDCSLENGDPSHKYTINTTGYPYNGQKLFTHMVYEDHIMCASYTDFSPTYEIFRMKDEKCIRMFGQELNNELSMNWNTEYVAYFISPENFPDPKIELRVFTNDHQNQRIQLQSGFVVDFFRLCQNVVDDQRALKNVSKKTRVGRIPNEEYVRGYESGFIRKSVLYCHFCTDIGGEDFEGNVFLDFEKRRYASASWNIFTRSEKEIVMDKGLNGVWKVEKKELPNVTLCKEHVPPEIFLKIVEYLGFVDVMRRIEGLAKGFRNNRLIWRMLWRRDWRWLDEEEDFKVEYVRRMLRKDPFWGIERELKWKEFKYNNI